MSLGFECDTSNTLLQFQLIYSKFARHLEPLRDGYNEHKKIVFLKAFTWGHKMHVLFKHCNHPTSHSQSIINLDSYQLAEAEFWLFR
jgi:hypothetical protein